MGKTIALAFPAAHMESYLTAKGYKVIDLIEASRPGSHVDAVLYGADPSESPLRHHQLDAAGSVGCLEFDDITEPVGIDVRGMRPEQTAETLELRLTHRHSRR